MTNTPLLKSYKAYSIRESLAHDKLSLYGFYAFVNKPTKKIGYHWDQQ